MRTFSKLAITLAVGMLAGGALAQQQQSAPAGSQGQVAPQTAPGGYYGGPGYGSPWGGGYPGAWGAPVYGGYPGYYGYPGYGYGPWGDG